jgi:hypothetical protein
MTQDERNMLADLANKFAQTPTPPKDPDAEDFIRKNIGSRPDALYLMTQTVLIQNMALHQAQNQIQEMQQRLSQPVPTSQGSGGSFLGGQSAPQQPQYQYAPAPPPQYAPAPSATGSFLRNAAQTAAGVAAGTLAVQGIESLFSRHEGFGGGGFGGGMFGGGGVGGYGGGETIIENNYYDDDPDSRRNDRFAASNDVSNDDQLQDTSYDDSSALGDDSNYDDGTGNDDNFS